MTSHEKKRKRQNEWTVSNYDNKFTNNAYRGKPVLTGSTIVVDNSEWSPSRGADDQPHTGATKGG